MPRDEIAVLDFREQVIRTSVQVTTQKTVSQMKQLAGQTTGCRKFQHESLILAQDERWRRA